ncbi:hypothetical protein WR25_17060 [Diploscapter pachys]|uniref:CUB domain-containing protein n=1 Tax=Diploscapter pachys TaxID=2018661 RepID=A0A2A2L3V1_9BILA|nr:hypothetical protein WR25_17060 [Diploscapter pachys]
MFPLFPLLLILPTSAFVRTENRSVSDSSGVLFSPNYPDNYDDNLDQFTTITVPVGNSVILTFLDFFTEQDYDHVDIYDGGDTTKNPDFVFSGDAAGSALNLTSNIVVIRFSTDMIGVARGFAIEWDPNPKDKPFQVKNSCEPAPKNSTFGLITSPNFPYNYPNNIQCNYLITTTKSRYSGTPGFFSVNSTGSSLFIVFSSDLQNSYSGFSALFESID